MRIKEITSKNVWEEFIATYSPQSLFQSWNWGEAVKKVKSQSFDKLRIGHSAELSRSHPERSRMGQKFRVQSLWRFVVYDADKLVGIAQVEKVTAKRGTFFHLRHGPVFSSWEKEYFSFLLDYLRALSKKENTSFIRISPLVENSPQNQQFFKAFGFHNAPIHSLDGEVCWVLDLDKDQAALLSGMRKTTRYLIRQAQKLGVGINKSKCREDINEFLSLYNKTAERHHFVKHVGIAEEFGEFINDDQILLFKGYYQGKLLAAALIIFYNQQAIYHHSASVESKVPVNYLLSWEAILEAKRRGEKVYNFWGIAEEGRRHPWRGLTMFKKGFGGRKIEYLHAQDLPLSSKYCATYIIERLRKIWKGY